jgi:flagellar biogenesis protein FliO
MQRIKCPTFILTIAISALATAAPGEDGSAKLARTGNVATDSSGGLDYQTPAWPEAPDTKAMISRLVTGTISVLGLCVATMLVGKRWWRGGPIKNSGGERLKVLESVSLGNRCTVVLVDVGGQKFLAGTDASGLKSLISVPDSFDHTLAVSQSAEPGGTTVGAELPTAAK